MTNTPTPDEALIRDALGLSTTLLAWCTGLDGTDLPDAADPRFGLHCHVLRAAADHMRRLSALTSARREEADVSTALDQNVRERLEGHARRCGEHVNALAKPFQGEEIYDDETRSSVRWYTQGADDIHVALAMIDRLATAPSAGLEVNDPHDLKERLHDLVMCKSEEDALNGGGPGIAERWKRAWANAMEVFEP